MKQKALRKLIEAGFKRIDERFNEVDSRFNQVDSRANQVDSRFNEVDSRFNKVDEQFGSLRKDFSEQLDGVSDGLHAETRALKQLIVEKANEGLVAVENLDKKMGLLGENLGNIRTQLTHYHNTFEAPLEKRVTTLEAHAWALDQEKKGRS
jgi:uncharacterized phage infection (PIP) family protein YhgE